VILLENSNEWNIPLANDGSLKREREEQGLKSKIGETSFEKLHVSKKKVDEIYKLLGEILSKERKKGDHIFL
jgi:predicted membrane chloride channel (bestrophin family)